MLVSFTITTRMAAKAAIDSCAFNSIDSTKYSQDDVRRFKRTLVAAAKAVPSLVGGGVHGHTYLLESNTRYQL